MKNQIASGFGLAGLAGVALAMVGMQATGLRSEEAREKAVRSEPARGTAATAAATGLEYTEAGELKRPLGFETWVFVGSNLGLEYSEDATKEKPAEKGA